MSVRIYAIDPDQPTGGPGFEELGLRHVYNYSGAIADGNFFRLICRDELVVPIDGIDGVPDSFEVPRSEVERIRIFDSDGNERTILRLVQMSDLGEYADFEDVRPHEICQTLEHVEIATLIALHEADHPYAKKSTGSAMNQAVEVLRGRRLVSRRAWTLTLKGRETAEYAARAMDQ